MRLRVAIAIVALVGLGIAVYLTSVHYAHVAPICTTGGCEKVQRSSYAELAGIPVAAARADRLRAPARDGRAARRRPRRSPGAFLALAGTVFSGYLLWAQLERIHAICIWCVGNDVAMALLAVLCSTRFLREPASS